MFDFYLEAVDKQQVQLGFIFLAQEVFLQILQVSVNVTLHLVKTVKTPFSDPHD